MKVIAPRDTTHAMGPLGAGPLLWSKLTQRWMRHTSLEKHPNTRASVGRYPEGSPQAVRYYKAIDAITNNRRAVCKKQPCDLCKAYLEGSGVFP